MKIIHIGIPTDQVYKDAIYVEDLGLHITDNNTHPHGIEYVRFEKDSWFPKEVQENAHVAVEVDNLEEALKDFDKVLIDKSDFGTMYYAFAIKDKIVYEVVEMK